MKESEFEAQVLKEISEELPGCVIIKNDPRNFQGIPDRLILYGHRWACLEFKRRASSSKRYNQEYYSRLLNEMSFSSFIEPSTKEQVLHELYKALRH